MVFAKYVKDRKPREGGSAFDHNHINGKFRGFLCLKCNGGLGCFNDSIELLLKAVKYLKEKNNGTIIR